MSDIIIDPIVDGGIFAFTLANIPSDKYGETVEVTSLRQGMPNLYASVSGLPRKISLYSDFFVGLATSSRELQFSGTATLAAGVVVVPTIGVGANSVIMITYQSQPASPGNLYVGTRINGTSFEIKSTNPTDTGTVGWCIVKQ